MHADYLFPSNKDFFNYIKIHSYYYSCMHAHHSHLLSANCMKCAELHMGHKTKNKIYVLILCRVVGRVIETTFEQMKREQFICNK